MKALLVLSGIHDPKWPLEWTTPGTLPIRRPDRFLLSPFDEAALELALRLRERGGFEIEAVVVGADEAEKLARVVAAYNLPVSILKLPSDELIDIRRLGEVLASVVETAEAEVVLMGREVGDLDDGALPAWLAARLARPFFALAQDVSNEEGDLSFVRERGEAEETLALDGHVLISVTNARRNRLRRPLVKNVMAAKQASLASLTSSERNGPIAVRLRQATAADTRRGKGGGRILQGSIQDQAATLAALLAGAEATQ